MLIQYSKVRLINTIVNNTDIGNKTSCATLFHSGSQLDNLIHLECNTITKSDLSPK